MRVSDKNMKDFFKKKFYYFVLGLRTIQVVVPFATLVFVSLVVYKELVYKNKVDTYEEYFTTIDYKLSNAISVDYENNFENEYSFQVKEYMNCINKKLTYDELSDDIKLSISTLQNLYNSSYNYFAFKYVDIYTGFSIGYNEEQEIFTASTIKAPMAIYLYEQAEEGKIDLDEKLTYTSAYYNTGSGVLKNGSFDRSITTRELISYAIIHSDNAAHNMLMDRYGRENMYNFWTNFGTKSIFRQYNNWGVINANDASIYMLELYKYYTKGTELSNELTDYFKNVAFKVITDKNGNTLTMNKSGWSGSVFHDVAIVLDDNPYILVVLTNTGQSYQYIMDQTSKLAAQLHEKYWDFKYNECNKIING